MNKCIVKNRFQRITTHLAVLAMCGWGALAAQAQAPPSFVASAANASGGSGAEDPQTTSPLEGSGADAKGGTISKANITVHNETTGRTMNLPADAMGPFTARVARGA